MVFKFDIKISCFCSSKKRIKYKMLRYAYYSMRSSILKFRMSTKPLKSYLDEASMYCAGNENQSLLALRLLEIDSGKELAIKEKEKEFAIKEKESAIAIANLMKDIEFNSRVAEAHYLNELSYVTQRYI